MTKPNRDRHDLSKLETYFKTHIKGDPTKATIAVPLTWPDIKNAEYEVIKRFCIAAENIGSKIIVTDNNGYPVWASDDSPVDDTRPLGREDVDFVLSLHFESPRLTDVYSYYAIWQPVSFYFDFGYEKSVEKVMTHNDALSCSSDLADAHVRSLMAAARPHPPEPFPYLFHSPPEPYYQPKITDTARLFYIGINWERLGSTKGRHHELLRLLDEHDLIDIYGPRVFLGKRPWEGFDTYRGEIPFDGTSVVRALAGSGICLAMSSGPHQQSGVMSNRLFEGLAAGAAVIANPHAIIDKYFSDVVYEIDDTVSDEEIFFQVKGIIEDIRRDPAAANQRARIGQERMRELFSLEKSLQALINQHDNREKTYGKNNTAKAKAEMTVVFPFRGHRPSEAARVIADLAAQTGIKLHLIFVCDTAFATGSGKALVDGLKAQFASLTVITEVFGQATVAATSGQALAAALPHIKTETMAMVRVGEKFFTDHFSALARRLADDPDAQVAVSGKLEETYEGTSRDRVITRKVAGLGFAAKTEQLLNDDDFSDMGRFMFRRTALDGLRPEFLALLDGLENVALLISALKLGRLQQNGIASYVAVTSDLDQHRPSASSLVRQRQFLRDMIKFDPDMNTLRDALEPIEAEATKPGGEAALYYPRLFKNDIVSVRTGGTGLAYLGTGFSTPEQSAVWIDGLTATLRFRLADTAPSANENLQLRITLAGRPSKSTGRPQHCSISVNGITLGYYALPTEPTPIVINLPVGAAAAETFRVRLTADHAEPVHDEKGAITDKRELGIFVTSFGITQATAPKHPELALNMQYDMRRGGSGQPLLVSGGFVDPEVTWLTEGPAALSFSVPTVGRNSKLSLQMFNVESAVPTDPFTVSCVINDVAGPTFLLTDTKARYDIPLTAEMVGPDGVCHLQLTPSHATRARDQNRVLSIGLESVSVIDIDDIEIGRVYQTVVDGAGLAFMQDGFSVPEAAFTWIDGRRATIEGQIGTSKGEDDPLELALSVSSRVEPQDEPRLLTVTVNGQNLVTETLTVEGNDVVVALPQTVLDGANGACAIELSLDREPDMVISADGSKVLDPRRLGVRVMSFEIRPAPQ